MPQRVVAAHIPTARLATLPFCLELTPMSMCDPAQTMEGFVWTLLDCCLEWQNPSAALRSPPALKAVFKALLEKSKSAFGDLKNALRNGG